MYTVPNPLFFPCVKRKSELGSIPNSPQIFFVGGDCVFVVSLFKFWIVWQSRYTLDPTYLLQYTPHCEIDMEEIKRTHLWTKVEITSRKQYIARNSTTCCCAPQSKVKLLWPEAKVRPFYPLSSVFCGCERDLCILEYSSELGGKEFCRCDVNL